MIKLYEEWKPKIQEYFEANNLVFSKIKGCGLAMGKVSGVNTLLILDATPDENSRLGLMDNTPAPVLLKVEETDGNLVFTPTEHTKEYFS